MRSRGTISADERHSYAEEEIGTRPAGVKERESGDWGRESGRSTGELVVRGPRAVEYLAHAPRRAEPDPRASRTPPGARAASCRCLLSRLSMSPPSPTCARLALAQPRCCCRPRRRAVAATPLSAALSPAQSTSAVAPMVAGTCVARAHACVRYGLWAGCGAHSESTSSIALPPPRQPLLSGHKSD